MKKYGVGVILLAVGFLIGASAGMAFQKKRPKWGGMPTPERMAHKLTHELQLSDTQKAQLIQRLTQRHAEMRVIRDATRSDIRALLTPEQQLAFDKIQMKRKKRFNRFGGRVQELESRRADGSGTIPKTPSR